MTPRLPPRVSISQLTLDRARQAEPATHAGEGGGSHTRASLDHGATRKTHAPTEPPAVRAGPPETPPAPPPKTKSWHTDAQGRHRRHSPSSLHLAQPLTSPPPLSPTSSSTSLFRSAPASLLLSPFQPLGPCFCCSLPRRAFPRPCLFISVSILPVNALSSLKP